MNKENILRRAEMELRGKEAEIKDLADRKNMLLAASALNNGVSPEDDPTIAEDWKSFTPEMKEAALKITSLLKSGNYPSDKVEEILSQALDQCLKMDKKIDWKQAAGRNATDAEVQELVDIMKKDGQEATEKRFKEMYGKTSTPPRIC